MVGARRQANKPHLQLGGVGGVEELGPGLSPALRLKHRQLQKGFHLTLAQQRRQRQRHRLDT